MLLLPPAPGREIQDVRTIERSCLVHGVAEGKGRTLSVFLFAFHGAACLAGAQSG